MLIEFSASRGRAGSKTYYKDFFQEAEQMKDMSRMLRRYAVSSYMYGDGLTDGGEEVQGRKAGETVVAPGNVLFFDFDSKYVPVTFDLLCQKLENVCAYIAPSRSGCSLRGFTTLRWRAGPSNSRLTSETTRPKATCRVSLCLVRLLRVNTKSQREARRRAATSRGPWPMTPCSL